MLLDKGFAYFLINESHWLWDLNIGAGLLSDVKFIYFRLLQELAGVECL